SYSDFWQNGSIGTDLQGVTPHGFPAHLDKESAPCYTRGEKERPRRRESHGQRPTPCGQSPTGGGDANGPILANSGSPSRVTNQSVECLSALGSLPAAG